MEKSACGLGFPIIPVAPWFTREGRRGVNSSAAVNNEGQFQKGPLDGGVEAAGKPGGALEGGQVDLSTEKASSPGQWLGLVWN